MREAKKIYEIQITYIEKPKPERKPYLGKNPRGGAGGPHRGGDRGGRGGRGGGP